MDNRSFPLRAWIYYSVTETATHYFIHYVYFHPRDYKNRLTPSALEKFLSRENQRRAGKESAGSLANEIALSHENDLEGCLVVAEKRGDKLDAAVVQFVETIAHNHFLKYCPREARPAICEAIAMDDERPVLLIEARSHGASHYVSNQTQMKKSGGGWINSPTGA